MNAADGLVGRSTAVSLAVLLGLPLIAFQIAAFTELPAWLVCAGISMPLAAFLGRGLRETYPDGAPDSADGVTRYFCDSAVTALATALRACDREIYLHCRRVQQLSLLLAPRCGVLDPRPLETLRLASLLHDLGKMAVRDAVLNKPSPLSTEEVAEMRAHSEVGARIVCKIPFDGPVVEWIRLHHERWDGSGYPLGLVGEEIPLEVRILAVADCYDALRSRRSYRDAFTREEAVRLLSAEAGRSFDPAVVALLFSHLGEIEALRAEVSATAGLDAVPALAGGAPNLNPLT